MEDRLDRVNKRESAKRERALSNRRLAENIKEIILAGKEKKKLLKQSMIEEVRKKQILEKQEKSLVGMLNTQYNRSLSRENLKSRLEREKEATLQNEQLVRVLEEQEQELVEGLRKTMRNSSDLMKCVSDREYIFPHKMPALATGYSHHFRKTTNNSELRKSFIEGNNNIYY